MPNSTSPGRPWLFTTIPVCLLLAIYFVFFSPVPSTSTHSVKELNPAWYTPELAREEYRKNATMPGNCFICHAFWVKVPPDPTVRVPRFAHTAISLNHGKNDRCYNCHLINDRNKYAKNDGSGIMPQTPEEVCAKCHGLIYNDWKKNTHGVRRGKWLARNRFDQEKFTCTDCHDPHSPVFKFAKTTPPPTWDKKYIRSGQATDNGPESFTSEYLIEQKETF
ncbi:cytochrome c3 family protein [Desulfomarina profundi]|nr:cytochrome c3 family protein [Desulfomarina profundi]